jgi:hypothetical protein
MAHVPVPEGVEALAGPTTLAVNVIVDPKFAVEAFGVTTTTGVYRETTMLVPPVVFAEPVE